MVCVQCMCVCLSERVRLFPTKNKERKNKNTMLREFSFLICQMQQQKTLQFKRQALRATITHNNNQKTEQQMQQKVTHRVSGLDLSM